MIFKKKIIIFTFFLTLSLIKIPLSEEKFESLIASVGSEAITTYDLSERIKLVLKSLKLEDNIKNRDSVRDRVLELLIIEKLKKIEATKSQITTTNDELIQFASLIYNFPVEDFKDFRLFIEEENIDFEIVLEQLKNELLWKKFSQQMFASKITINSIDVDVVINNYKNRIGQIEYDYSEIVFLNDITNDWEISKKKMNTVLSLLEDGASFKLLAEKFSDEEKQTNNKDDWILEESLDAATKEILKDMNTGEIKKNIKTNNGYRIIKLNKKRKFGEQSQKFTFLRFSSFEKKPIELLQTKDFNCKNKQDIKLSEDIKFLEIKEVIAKDLSREFLMQIKRTSEKNFTDIFEISGEYNLLFICSKKNSEVESLSRETIERKAFSRKFNQLSNTFLFNIKKSANIKFFNK